MSSLKVNITCEGESIKVQKLQIEPDNWHHRFEISVASRMVDHKSVISIEMNEVAQVVNEKQPPLIEKNSPPALPHKSVETSKTTIQRAQPESSQEKETSDSIDGSVWL